MKPTARERILTRLRQARAVEAVYVNPVRETDREWLARQPEIGDLAERFTREQEAVGGDVRRVTSWEALPDTVLPWLGRQGVASIMTGTEPRLEPLRARIAESGRFALHCYERSAEEQGDEIFAVDCGITTSRGAIAETGSVIVVPTPEEPRLLSLAPAVHLAIVERARLYATLSEYIETGAYQAELPSNHVLVSGASRTADIEMTLVVGVHGPKVFLVALIG